MIQIRPVNARTLLRPVPKEDVQVGSLILPGGGSGDLEEALALWDFNMVDAAGLTVLITKGDKVIYPQGAGIGHLINGVHHVWVVITDIWGIVEDVPVKMAVVGSDKGDNL